MARNALAIAMWTFVARALIQIFLAGLGVFRSPADFEIHRTFGYLLELAIILLGALAAVLRVGRRIIGLAVLIFVLFLVQSILVSVRGSTLVIAALHPVNGFLIVFTSILLARETWRLGGVTEQ